MQVYQRLDGAELGQGGGRVRQTLNQLDAAISAAAANNETQITGTNVSGVLVFNGSTTEISSATSSSSNIQTGISVNGTLQNANRQDTGNSGLLTASDVSVNIARTQNDVTTQQIYNGALTAGYNAANDSTEVVTLDYSGDLRSASSREFTGSISISEISPTSEPVLSGNYNADFAFSSGTSLSLSGRLQSQLEGLSISGGTSTVMADLQTNVITDMTADLNLATDGNDQVTSGTITVNGEAAADMDSNGVVTFSDGTTTALPAPII